MASLEKIGANERGRAALAAALLMCAGTAFLTGLTVLPNAKTRHLAVIFPPTAALTDILGDLSAHPVQFIGTGGWDNIVVVRPEDGVQADHMQFENALFVVDALAGGACLSAESRSGSLKRGLL
ncbi:hypothetical protein [Sneathiella chinensis]|uniref:hypothetical protein n=1 Tax=Sneathiella chinensis TaxID=349750 RepID=UPI0024E12070|nr:hypothetical protein [Sneathiella chinensis]